jgi:two-component system, cell cycle sensor histidine kinase and response regulator CckA
MIDATDRHSEEASTAINEELSNFCSLANMIDDLVFVWKPVGTMLWVNKVFEEQTGRIATDFEFPNADNPFIHPEDLPAVNEQLAAFMRSSDVKSQPISNRFFDAWGRARPLTSTIHKIQWQGEPALLFISKFESEPSERVALEERGFKSLLDSVDDGIFKVEVSGRFLFANQRMHVLANLTAVELGKMTLVQLISETRSSVVNSALLALSEGERRCSLREQLTTSGKWVDVKLQAMRDPNDSIVIVGLVRDVSESLLAQEREEFYRQIFDATSDAIFIHDERGRVLDVNLGALRMFRCERGALIDGDLFVFSSGVPPYSAAEASEHLRLAIEKGQCKFDWRSRRQDGDLFWSEVSLRAASIGGNVRIIASVHDIDERKHAENELQQNEKRLSFAFSATADAIWELNLQTGERYFSPRWYSMLGYQDQQLPMTAETFTYLCHPDDIRPTLESLEAVRASSQNNGHEAEYRMRRADGSWCWILSRSNVVERDINGRALLMSGTSTDVTERRRAEEVLAEKEHRFRLMIQNVNDMLLILDPDGTVSFVSPACTPMLGYVAHELVGRSAYSFMHADDVVWVRSALQGLLESKDRVIVLAFREIHRDGAVLWVEASGTNLVDDPTIGGVILAVRDISRRRQSELETLEWRRRYDLLTLAAGNVVYDCDLHGSVVWGGGFEQMLGYTTKDMEGGLLQWMQRVHPDDVERVRNQFAQSQTYGTSFRIEYRYRRLDGAYALVEDVNYPYFNEQGKAERFIGMLVDITKRRKVDEENAKLAASLRQAQKMESIGRLAGGVAHDFNNLLTVISGNVSFAMLDLQTQDPLYESMTEISRAVDSAAALTRQLLAFSRKQVIDPRVLNLNTLVERLHKMLTRLLGEDIELRANLSATLAQVRVDPGQVEQAIVNLAVNARDAMPDGGCLTLETANVTLDEAFCRDRGLAQPGEFVMLAITDDGCGMDEEVKAHLFEPFFTTKEQGKGTGLGLSTVYGIVAQNGGVIELFSEPRRGTTFKIYLPRTDAEPQSLQDRQLTRPPRGGETIILVEDDDMVREVAVRLLKRQGYRVHAYANGGEAMMAAGEIREEFHLLITDVVMPGINGRILSQNLRALRPSMKVLFTSGYTGDVMIHHGMLDEGIEFIAKPYTLEQLAKRVRDVLDLGANGHGRG